MQLPQFEHLAPSSIAEACSLLAAHQSEALVLAGGTDLFVKMKARKVVPRYLVDIKGIAGMDYIRFAEGDGLRVGALATIQALKSSSVVKRQCKILGHAAAAESSVQIRNLATLGGNIANASPAADCPLALVTVGANVVLARAGGQREIPLEAFARAPGRTVLEPGELLSEIHVPPLPPRTGVAYAKHSTRRTDIAIVSAAVVLTLGKDGCIAVRIGLGSVAPTIMRARQAEEMLLGKAISDDVAEAAAQLAAAECSPIDDIRQSAGYRKKIIAEITRLAILQAAMDARS